MLATLDEISLTEIRINNALNELLNCDGAETDLRLRSKIIAVENAVEMWEVLQLEAVAKSKLHKLQKKFAEYLDFEIKHSTGGTLQGYSIVMNVVRKHL